MRRSPRRGLVRDTDDEARGARHGPRRPGRRSRCRSGCPSKAPPRIAAIVTEYRKRSHAQGIVDRFLDGYGWKGRHYRPGVEIVSLYVDQKPSNDLSEERAKRHPGLKVYPTIAAGPHPRRRSAGR